MIRYIKSNDSSEVSSADIVRLLKSHGIDATKAKYEYSAEGYERYGRGKQHKFTFTCPGDWLAYFSMRIHEPVTPDNLAFEFGGDENLLDELDYWMEKCPTVEAIRRYASESWWGDGSDYIYYLKNLSTGKTLYVGDDDETEVEDYEDEW